MKTHAVDEEYSRLASVYDTKWKFYVEATVRETLARVTIRPGDRVLDVGCGTGTLLDTLARDPGSHGVRAGIDPVAAMLAVARRRARVPLVQGRAEQLPFRAGTFDVVLSSSVLHYIPEPAAAVREMARVLRPGGTLAITDWCADYLSMRMLGRYLRLTGSSYETVYSGRDCAQLFVDAGLKPPRIDRYRINWWWGMMTAVAEK